MNICSIITTKDRPQFLRRTLPAVVALGARVLVVDDGSSLVNAELNAIACEQVRPEAPSDVLYLRFPENRGLAAALNTGLSFWMAENPDYISYFQDDVEVDPELHKVLSSLHRALPEQHRALLTGHDAREHKAISGRLNAQGISYFRKGSCRATQMFASARAWAGVMPIRSRGVGYPKRTGPDRGEGSNVDWYITRDHTHPLKVHCVPGLVRTFAWEAHESCWNNRQTAGEDGPLSRESIELWLRRNG